MIPTIIGSILHIVVLLITFWVVAGDKELFTKLTYIGIAWGVYSLGGWVADYLGQPLTTWW